MTPPTRGVRLCPVCSTDPATTTEDIIPRWLRKRLRQIGSFNKDQIPSELLRVCESCNGTFGRTLEDKVAPILGPMIIGERCELTQLDQELIGCWIAKTALLLDLARMERVPAHRSAIRELLIGIKSGETPKGTFARLGTIDPYDIEGPPEYSLHKKGEYPAMVTNSNVFFGNLVIEAAVLRFPDELNAFIEPDNEWLINVSPARAENVVWPPPSRLTYASTTLLRQAWESHCWPPPTDTRLTGYVAQMIGENPPRPEALLPKPGQTTP